MKTSTIKQALVSNTPTVTLFHGHQNEQNVVNVAKYMHINVYVAKANKKKIDKIWCTYIIGK